MNMNIKNIKVIVLGESKKLNNNIQNLLQQITDFASEKKGFTVYANSTSKKILSSTLAVFIFNNNYTNIR
jgi:hypothetical protein